MFIDEVNIKIKAGNGGSGAVSFYPMKKGPCGGHGGNGGNVTIFGDPQHRDLHTYSGSKIYKAEDGGKGQTFRQQGKDGKNLILKVPYGTFIFDSQGKELFEITKEHDEFKLASGGLGGRGNSAFVSSTNQVPRNAESGEQTAKIAYRLVLKLIANYGLIGLPNAGKSSLLNELTMANVKTAPYAFTTLEPNLGVFEDKIIADIPGLIEGAARGKGLGFKFLKHIEKVSRILHCIASDSLDVERDYAIVQNELAQYKQSLLDTPQVILMTKSDLVDEQVLRRNIKKLHKYAPIILPISLYNPEQMEALMKLLQEKI